MSQSIHGHDNIQEGDIHPHILSALGTFIKSSHTQILMVYICENVDNSRNKLQILVLFGERHTHNYKYTLLARTL